MTFTPLAMVEVMGESDPKNLDRQNNLVLTVDSMSRVARPLSVAFLLSLRKEKPLDFLYKGEHIRMKEHTQNFH